MEKTGEKYSRDCDCGNVALKILGTGLRHAYQAMAKGTFIFAWVSREHPQMNSNPQLKCLFPKELHLDVVTFR